MPRRPVERAFWRQFDYSLRAALRVARWDQQALSPRSAATTGTDYLGVVLWDLDHDTRPDYERRLDRLADRGIAPQLKLSDYAPGGVDA